MTDRFDELAEVLDSADQSSEEFRRALQELEHLANRGSIEAADVIAEVFAFSEKHRDSAKAYKWYHVTLAVEGYLTEYSNQNESPTQYCGPVGDFRNEPQVNELVGQLGESRARELDGEASVWLRKHRTVL